MCMIGGPRSIHIIPKEKARRAYRTHKSTSWVMATPQHGRPYKKGVEYRASRPPTWGGETGFWCYTTRRGAEDAGFSTRIYRIVVVRVWGRVVRHSRGYRAQYMRRVS